ncbi:MAG TPA: hypothetical protein VKR59_04630 [Terriglobales bacterium]|nr:hypothetical protein [Terriglobales bacterium]
MAPKSDNATIAARRARLLELLAEGRTQVQAVEILRSEGFPADRITIWRDVKSFDLETVNSESQDMEAYRSMQLDQLSELREQLKSPLIRSDKKISLALGIIDREITLLGTEAPKKSFRVNASVDPESSSLLMRFKSACAGLSDGQIQEVFDFAQRLPRPTASAQRDESWFPKDQKVIEGER